MRRLTLLWLFGCMAATAGESPVPLKDGPGKELATANCAMCHSLDYLTMNAAILDRTGWEKTVGKMIDVMGAPIRDADRQAIVDYLARNYGK